MRFDVKEEKLRALRFQSYINGAQERVSSVQRQLGELEEQVEALETAQHHISKAIELAQRRSS
jgi:predicted  nucleic acid-binding Zn-ribbon protein